MISTRYASARRLARKPFTQAVAAITSDAPDRHDVRYLVDQSYRFALAYLKQKVRQRRLQPSLFGLTLEDLAFDCFADLFERNDQGRFVQLATFFESARWRELDEAGLRSSFRRLVFSKVNEGLFRRYREADPNLAKIIRNVKNAIKADARLSIERRPNGAYLVVNIAPESAQLPVAPTEIMEAYLIGRLCRSEALHEAVASFVGFAFDHPYYAPEYPLIPFAQALRTAFLHAGQPPSENNRPAPFLSDEVSRAILLVIDGVQDQMHASYVGRGKVEATTYQAYFRAISDVLHAEYVSSADPVASYFDALGKYLPGLPKDTYRQEHRHVMEYLAKMARAQLLDYLQDEPCEA